MFLTEAAYERHDVMNVCAVSGTDGENVKSVKVDCVVITQLTSQTPQVLLSHGKVDLVSDDCVRRLRHPILVHLKFVAQRIELHPRVINRHVKHVQDAGTAPDVT